LQPKITQVLIRYKLTSTMHLDHSILLWISNQAREMSGREYAQLKRTWECQKYPREFPKSWPTHIYKGHQRNGAVRHWTLLCADAPDAQVLTHLTLTSVRSPPH
jgi:hypothetical protein